jgi:ABC-2 family transporter protein
MIRFAWLQARTQTLVAVGGLVILAIVVGVTGPHLAHLYDRNVASCPPNRECSAAVEAFLRNDRNLAISLGALVDAVPVLLGLFWGAPLIARELEAGTHRLAWTQSVTRNRWLAVKLAVVGLVSMTVAGLVTLMVTWWESPLDTVKANRFAPLAFDERGIVSIGYAAFAVALGITLGLLIRRTIPAMATALAAFAFVRVATINWIRPHLIAPRHLAFALKPRAMGLRGTNSGAFSLLPPFPRLPNAWIYSTHFVDSAGGHLSHRFITRACPHLGESGGQPPHVSGGRTKVPPSVEKVLHDCAVKVGEKYHLVSTYQPAKHYWTFQWIELVMYLGAAAILCGCCFWLIHRRLS